MKNNYCFLSTRTTKKCLLRGITLSALFASASAFGDDKQVLDELYNEIMSASIQDQGTIDSGVSKSAPVSPLKINSLAEPNSEKLQLEIEKMVEEAKTRHSDAVKFMQESR